jgi:hypothetical protein
MSEQPQVRSQKESLLSVIIIAGVVGAMSLTIWPYRLDHPDFALLVGGWISVAFTVSIALHLRKMARCSRQQSSLQRIVSNHG